ncbi:nucleotide-binding protein [Neorhizobium galegae]|uniref:TIR domain-containing protein n=1 Tax=Neorhizobium galegae TaxID=399 RepID=UPI00210165A2|nr:nucleotide-binding protein [Neorhizobium galegae]
MSGSQYPRKTLLAAVQILKSLGHSGFERLLIEFGLPDENAGKGSGLMDRANSLAKFALQNPDERTADGVNLWDAMVDRAIEEDKRFRPTIAIPNVTLRERQDFQRAIEQYRGQILSDYKEAAPFIAEADARGENTTEALGLFLESRKVSDASTGEKLVPSKVFIVHGRDEAPKEAVARFIERLGFEAIILHEQTNKGRTVIEKFIEHSNVNFAVVLLTPDDFGGLSGEEAKPRARQNVILEWGFFIGALGRENVVALMKDMVDIPSDVVGLVWERLDDHGAWRVKLAKEMQASGFKIEWEKVSL